MFRKIYIEIINICNLKCKFCPETNRDKEFMSVEKFEDIVKKIHNYTKLVCLHVKGEPLLHSQLEEILKILEKYNLKANITTNGTLIKEKFMIIKNSKAIRQINFSIHSILQNKEINSEYLQDIFNCAEQLNNIMISYRLWNLKSIKENIIERGRCLALKDQIAILVDGTVVPCCLDNNGDIPLGNIFNESLEEILQKSKSMEIKKNFENSIITCKLCKTCGFLKRLETKRK